jgi:hypothetical protein
MKNKLKKLMELSVGMGIVDKILEKYIHNLLPFY